MNYNLAIRTNQIFVLFDNNLYCYDLNTEQSAEITQFNRKVKLVASSAERTVVVTDDNKIYQSFLSPTPKWTEFQKHVQQHNKPMKELADLTITHVAVANDHVLIATDTGQIFCCGDHSHFPEQLIFPYRQDDMFCEIKITADPIYSTTEISHLVTSENNTVIVFNGKLATIFNREHTQLGTTPERQQINPHAMARINQPLVTLRYQHVVASDGNLRMITNEDAINKNIHFAATTQNTLVCCSNKQIFTVNNSLSINQQTAINFEANNVALAAQGNRIFVLDDQGQLNQYNIKTLAVENKKQITTTRSRQLNKTTKRPALSTGFFGLRNDPISDKHL